MLDVSPIMTLKAGRAWLADPLRIIHGLARSWTKDIRYVS